MQLNVPNELGKIALSLRYYLTLEGKQQGQCELDEGLPALEQEQSPETTEDVDGQLLREESEKPTDGITLGREIVALEVPVQCGQVVVDINIQHIAYLPHSLQMVIVVPYQLQIPQEVSTQEICFLLCQSYFEHCPHDTMKALYINKAVDLTAQLEYNSFEIDAHCLQLLSTAAKPYNCTVDIHAYPFPIVIVLPALPYPPFTQLPFPQYCVPHEFLLLPY